MRRSRRRLAFAAVRLAAPLVGVAALASACGPVTYIGRSTLEASREVSHAKESKAEKFAPYEMTAAQEYLHKSRELAGYARFEGANDFAKKSADLAREAKSIADDKARQPGAAEETTSDETPTEAKPPAHDAAHRPSAPPVHDETPPGPSR